MQGHTTHVRLRPYVLKTTVVELATNSTRQTLLTPAAGRRIHLVHTKIIQVTTDGRHLWELYFGTAANIIAVPDKAIDVLICPDLNSVSTRTFLAREGPRGTRNEVLSTRNRGVAPTTAHKAVIQYTEEA